MIGNFSAGSTVRIKFNTSSGGSPITLVGGTAAVYKDGGTTEITAGVTLTTDFDSRTGYHQVAVDTSADAAYAAGSDFSIVLTAGTVDGVSQAGREVGSFSLDNRTPTAAAIRAEMDANSTNLNLAATAANAASVKIGDFTGGDTVFAWLGEPVSTSLSADIAATKAAAEAAETAASTGINIDEADMAAIAAKVVAARGTYYPARALVWVLQRDAEDGIVVKDSFIQSKQTDETAIRYIDFGSLLGRNEAVESIDELTIAGSTFVITADSDSLVGNLLKFTITGGAAGATGTVSFEVTTTADQVLTGEVQISVPE